MLPFFYIQHADWWPLLSKPDDYQDEAEAYARVMRDACECEAKNILELGCGGGNNASFLKNDFQMTLTDLSPTMLEVSKALNPECEHIQGDMRSLKLDHMFDGIFVHDAINYMTTRDDVRRVMETAFTHCRSGGAALFVPDYTKETFREATGHGGHDGQSRSLRYFQWDHDPDPSDSIYCVELSFLFREGTKSVQAEHETHHCGLFSIEEWYDALRSVGFVPSAVTLETDELESGIYRIFTGQKP